MEQGKTKKAIRFRKHEKKGEETIRSVLPGDPLTFNCFLTRGEGLLEGKTKMPKKKSPTNTSDKDAVLEEGKMRGPIPRTGLLTKRE